MILVEPTSAAALLIRARANGQVLGPATGFVVQHGARSFLITNRHVVRGRHNDTDAVLHNSAAIPDSIEVAHHASGALGQTVAKFEPLYEDEEHEVPRWLEHPSWGGRVDVVAVPLTDTNGVDIHPLDPWAPIPTVVDVPVAWRVTDRLSIVGYPYGVEGTAPFAVWVQGTVASEPNLDWDGLPLFLIDSRTREGQSGSPVIFHSSGGWLTVSDQTTRMHHDLIDHLVGVYSGRINKDADLGRVWKIEVVRDIIDAVRSCRSP